MYCLIFCAALLVRLVLLGRVSLIESEASWAFQAWQLYKDGGAAVGSQVGYLAFTEGLFTLFGGNDYLARIWPALVGSLIVWVPFQFRKHLDRIPALLLAFGLALDPGLVSVSRIVGGPIPALVFLFLAAGAFQAYKIHWFIFLLGLGLFSGPAFWLGAIMLGITLGLGSLLGYINLRQYIQARVDIIRQTANSGISGYGTIFSPLLFLGVVGSFFFTNIQGLSAWMESVPSFFASWGYQTGFHPFQVLINLAISNPLILIFGGLGFIAAWLKNDRIGKMASIWFGISLLVILIYPGRKIVDLIWLALPLWVSTAREIIRIFNLAKKSWVVNMLVALVGVLFVLNWLTFTGMIFQIGNAQALLLQGGLIAASLALIVLSMTMVASEWGWSAGKKGLALGAAGMLVVYMISALVQGAFLRAGDPRSLWSDGFGVGQDKLLLDSIVDASISRAGRGDAIQGVVIDGSDILRWTLRDLEGIEFNESLDPENKPPIVITSENEYYLVDQEIYRGQDFVLLTTPGWDGFIPNDWISWIAFRSGPIENEDIILWVRNDVLSGY